MSQNKNKIVTLYPDIGYHILNFLDGIDLCNFTEVVNESDQFFAIATATDENFRVLIKQIFSVGSILNLPIETIEKFMDDFQLEDDSSFTTECNSCFIWPCPRGFIHNCFSIESFRKLCRAYRTPLFKCYSRLLSFNISAYSADFGVIDYTLFKPSMVLERDFNEHELNLFKVNTYFEVADSARYRSMMKFVDTLDEFRHNFGTRFFAHLWIDTIDFSKFVIMGSSVLDTLYRTPFDDTNTKTIKLVYLTNTSVCTEFFVAVQNTIQKLVAVFSSTQIKVHKCYGSLHYDVYLPCNVKLQFIFISNEHSKDPLSHLLYNFDFEIAQVIYTGHRILCTFAFLNALSTKSFIVYSLFGGSTKHTCNRIAKYCARGFQLLVPIHFDGNFEILMKQAETSLYHYEQIEYLDDDNELKIEAKEYWRKPTRNIDTFHVQEHFIANIDS